LADAHHEADFPERAVVVTFDDGYFDNLSHAKPLLEHYDIPATVFVTTGYLGQPREFWWDELDRLLLQPGTLPQTLCLCVNGHVHHWELGEASHYSEEAYRCHRSWNVLRKDVLGPRQRFYLSLHQMLRPVPEEERRRLLDELIAWAGVGPIGRSTHRTLSPEEVIRLAEGGLVEVGAHTVTHPVLSILPAAAQQAEVHGSKARLQEILGRPVTSFAYPYGFRSDYTAQSAAIVREAGFACACSCVPDLVWRGTGRFQLPRIIAFNWDGDEFTKRLRRWFHQ
jgi:peptidoglycan/xylan/chitin deacetylase (PgdA/CDA1 family)